MKVPSAPQWPGEREPDPSQIFSIASGLAENNPQTQILSRQQDAWEKRSHVGHREGSTARPTCSELFKNARGLPLRKVHPAKKEDAFMLGADCAADGIPVQIIF